MKLSTAGLTLAPDAAIDLHLHTTWSDGHWELEPLLDHLVREKFALAAITDHDRTDKLAEIQQLALEKHLPVLVGVEMSATWHGEMTDLLCYGFEPGPSALDNLARDLMLRQQENTRKVIEKIGSQGYPLPPEVLADVLETPSSRQSQALVDRLRDQGYDLGDPALQKMIMDAGLAIETSQPAEVVAAAHRSGAVCMLAHPGHKEGFVTYDEALLDEFRREAPIDGLEVYHPLHTPEMSAMYRDYARRNSLLISAGSDSHKPEKPPIKYQAELCRDLLERLGMKI